MTKKQFKKVLLTELGLIISIIISNYYVKATIDFVQARQLKEKVQVVNMTKTNEDWFKPEIIVKQVNYTAKQEKEVISNPSEDNKVYLGKFKITHYCACKKCCGPNAQGITASGKRVEEGKTIAVDTKVIKLGSKVYIDGYGKMEAQDTGSAIKGNIIDVYVADHNEALKMGVVYKDVYLVK